MADGCTKYGDWGLVLKKLDKLGVNIDKATKKATVKAAMLLVREIKIGIRNQAPGGKAFVPLADSTIDRKGSSKALIDTGFLLNAITQKIVNDQAFVGILRGSVGKDGTDRANIGAIMEFGATITMPSGRTFTIPPRPFIHPTFEAMRPKILKLYEEALDKALKA